MHAKIKYNGIIAYTFLSKYEKKITSFCQVLKEMHVKENCFLFFCLAVYMRYDTIRDAILTCARKPT